LSLSVIKLLGAGEYAVERPGGPSDGHFGLAVGDYTHSTAPNRRYPDLATQRLLKAAMAQQPTPYSADELAALAAHCTEQQNNAAKVERQVQKSAAALFLASRLHEQFDAIVTGASAKGRGCERCARRSKDAWFRARKDWTSAIACGSSCFTPMSNAASFSSSLTITSTRGSSCVVCELSASCLDTSIDRCIFAGDSREPFFGGIDGKKIARETVRRVVAIQERMDFRSWSGRSGN
jgi:hypothetical protein